MVQWVSIFEEREVAGMAVAKVVVAIGLHGAAPVSRNEHSAT